jgi:hypothetical protein
MSDAPVKNRLAAHLWVESAFTDARLTKEDLGQIAEHMLTVENGLVDGTVTDAAAAAAARLMTEILVAKKTPPPVIDKHRIVADYIATFLKHLNVSENAIDDLAARVMRQSAEPCFDAAGNFREHVVTLQVYLMSEQTELSHLFAGPAPATQEQIDTERKSKEKLICGLPESELLSKEPAERLRIVNAYEEREGGLSKEAKRKVHNDATVARMDKDDPQWRELQKAGNTSEVWKAYERASAKVRDETKGGR